MVSERTAKQTVSLSEAQEDFSKIARIAEQNGEIEMTDEEKIDVAAARILRRYRKAFEELAK